jgi:hypothetical protein
MAESEENSIGSFRLDIAKRIGEDDDMWIAEKMPIIRLWYRAMVEELNVKG